jgi:signal transduction histidine kinase
LCPLLVGLQTLTANFSVLGVPERCTPIVRDEVYRIGYEAIRNAFMHSQAKKLEVSLKYGQDLNLRVSDDGVGIDPMVASKGKAGHFGLQGMRERAGRIGAKLSLISNLTGTELSLRFLEA